MVALLIQIHLESEYDKLLDGVNALDLLLARHEEYSGLEMGCDVETAVELHLAMGSQEVDLDCHLGRL